MTFAAEDLARIADAEEIELEPRSAGRRRPVVIWVVVDGDDVFVRSVRGPSGRWFQETLADPKVALHFDERTLEARAVPATDPASVTRASNAFRTKYAADPAMPSMLRPETLDTTLRLEPA
jgi:hypothetical protein